MPYHELDLVADLSGQPHLHLLQLEQPRPYRPIQAEMGRAAQWLAKHGRAGQGVIVILEHQPVYTLGHRGSRASLTAPDLAAAAGIQVVETDRGGDITYHGPGQLVAYPIVHLGSRERDVKEWVFALEEAMVRTCAHFGVATHRVAGMRGLFAGTQAGALSPRDVSLSGDCPSPRGEGPALSSAHNKWCSSLVGAASGVATRATADGDGLAETGSGLRKIGAVGVRITGGVSRHGLALNVAPDMSHFEYIVPCGLTGVAATSLQLETGTVRRDFGIRAARSVLGEALVVVVVGEFAEG